MFCVLFAQADQSGTIVEILAEDGKPVSMESVCFITLSHLLFDISY